MWPKIEPPTNFGFVSQAPEQTHDQKARRHVAMAMFLMVGVFNCASSEPPRHPKPPIVGTSGLRQLWEGLAENREPWIASVQNCNPPMNCNAQHPEVGFEMHLNHALNRFKPPGTSKTLFWLDIAQSRQCKQFAAAITFGETKTEAPHLVGGILQSCR